MGQEKTPPNYNPPLTKYTSRLFPIGVGRDHFLPLATILRFFHFHQISHTRSPVSGTLDLA
jgi:hypothetical protein